MIDHSHRQATRRHRCLHSIFSTALWACWLATGLMSAQSPADAPKAQQAPESPKVQPKTEPEKQPAPPTAPAQEAGPPETAKSNELPKAEVILDQYIAATGGKAAYEKIRNQVLTGRFEYSQDQQGSLKVYLAAPNLMYSLAEVEGYGTSEQGFDGKTAWQKMGGARIKEGEERSAAIRDATLFPELNWRKLFAKAQTVGMETIDGRPNYKVVLTPEEGSAETRFFDAESHLLAKTVKTTKSQAGEIPVEIYILDYLRVDGILVPRSKVHHLMGQQQTIIVEKAEHNVELPKDRFRLPDEVAALLKKEAASPGEKPAAEPPKKP